MKNGTKTCYVNATSVSVQDYMNRMSLQESCSALNSVLLINESRYVFVLTYIRIRGASRLSGVERGGMFKNSLLETFK